MSNSTGRSLLVALMVASLAGAAWATDSDGDGLSDSLEAAIGTDPDDAMSDSDNWNDYREWVEEGTSPLDEDTNGNGTPDHLDSPSPLLEPSGDQDGGTTASRQGWLTGSETLALGAWSGQSAVVGAGVYPHSGALSYSFTIAQTKGLGLDFGLTFRINTQADSDGSAGRNVFWLGDTKIYKDGDGDVWLLMEDGVLREFDYDPGTGTYASPAGIPCSCLTEISTGVFEREILSSTSCAQSCGGEVYKYRYANGTIDWYADKFGNKVDFIQDQQGLVTQLDDTRGLSCVVTSYPDTERVKSFQTADGATWTFLYNVYGQLHSVVGPATTSFPDGIRLNLRWTNGGSNSELNNNLATVFDGRGNVALRMEYDQNDRVARQRIGSDWMSIDNSQVGNYTATVTDPNGNQKVLVWDSTKMTLASLTEKTNRDVRANEGDYTTTFATDSDGYLTSVTYPRGNGVKYTLDDVKLVTESGTNRSRRSMTTTRSTSCTSGGTTRASTTGSWRTQGLSTTSPRPVGEQLTRSTTSASPRRSRTPR